MLWVTRQRTTFRWFILTCFPIKRAFGGYIAKRAFNYFPYPCQFEPVRVTIDSRKLRRDGFLVQTHCTLVLSEKRKDFSYRWIFKFPRCKRQRKKLNRQHFYGADRKIDTCNTACDEFSNASARGAFTNTIANDFLLIRNIFELISVSSK